MLRAWRKRTRAWATRKRRPDKRKRRACIGSRLMATPSTPQDRETRWKMHVLRAVDRGDAVVSRPADEAVLCGALPRGAENDVAAADDDDNGAFVRLALDVLDDCREVTYARPLEGGVVAIGPRATALWGGVLDRALDAARQEAATRSPILVDMRAIHAACGAAWPLAPRCCEILGKMVTTGAVARHMDVAALGPFVYRLTLDGTDGAEPGPEQWPPIGWALAKAYCMVVAVIVPLILALCTTMD
nr:hypothetical protein [Pandoravirus massiliensis]